MRIWLLIGGFGALGAIGRYAMSGAVYRIFGTSFAHGTLAVNVLGSFLLGAIMEISLGSTWISAEWRSAIGIGFIGAFTTFSTFSYETWKYLEDGDWWRAGANVGLNVVLCLMACAAAVHLSRFLLGGGR
ncbi:MAG: fluoride efflux transporter CrcB [Deltaproteobacteria bacterium]|nr:fluoride efflux transporter CrcB [Deltaproteobacteria bacterium]